MNTAITKHTKRFFVAMSAVALLGGSLRAEDGTKFSGFVDAGFLWTKGGNNNTFGVNDGAVYMNHMFEKGKVMVDLPFSFASATNANFNFATAKAQAFVAYEYDNGFMWQIGQFDRIFGFEKNDTWDVRFTRRGVINSLLPTVQTGLLLGYNMDPVTFQVLVANPRDAGQMNGNIPDYGAKLAFSSQMIRVHGAFLQEQNTGGNSSNSLYDFLIGTTYERLTADFSFDILKPTTGDSATGFHLTLGYDVNDQLKAGIRGEMLKKFAGIDTVNNITVGPQYWMTKNLQVKLDWTLTSTKVVSGADSVNGQSIGLAALHSF